MEVGSCRLSDKKIRGFDAELAFEAMKKRVENIQYYSNLGFIPADKVGGSVSMVMEYAYNDWSVAQMARHLNKTDDYNDFTYRAQSYKNMFDSSIGLIGQYAHGNEPSHHMAYLYNYAGVPWKTQAIVYEILETMYDDQPDGLSGNEDCGQMSAWYILSAMGFYQVCPGTPEYIIGTPMFDKSERQMCFVY